MAPSVPSNAPTTSISTLEPSFPTIAPSAPSNAPTSAPLAPSSPTIAPSPTKAPTKAPTTKTPTQASNAPTKTTSAQPTNAPTGEVELTSTADEQKRADETNIAVGLGVGLGAILLLCLCLLFAIVAVAVVTFKIRKAKRAESTGVELAFPGAALFFGGTMPRGRETPKTALRMAGTTSSSPSETMSNPMTMTFTGINRNLEGHAAATDPFGSPASHI